MFALMSLHCRPCDLATLGLGSVGIDRHNQYWAEKEESEVREGKKLVG